MKYRITEYSSLVSKTATSAFGEILSILPEIIKTYSIEFVDENGILEQTIHSHFKSVEDAKEYLEKYKNLISEAKTEVVYETEASTNSTYKKRIPINEPRGNTNNFNDNKGSISVDPELPTTKRKWKLW